MTARTPDGILLGWTPGKLPLENPEGMAWRLDEQTDIVLQLHMVPSGKPERVNPRIGLYYAERPPVLEPFVLVLRNDAIDIAVDVTSQLLAGYSPCQLL